MDDASKMLDELYDGQLGDYIRERFIAEIHSELEGLDEDDGEWGASVQEWLRENWG